MKEDIVLAGYFAGMSKFDEEMLKAMSWSFMN